MLGRPRADVVSDRRMWTLAVNIRLDFFLKSGDHLLKTGYFHMSVKRFFRGLAKDKVTLGTQLLNLPGDTGELLVIDNHKITSTRPLCLPSFSRVWLKN